MRPLRWAFILFQFAWLNVVLPGHTRGSITVPGTKPTAPACCAGHQAGSRTPAENQQPTPADRANCAICYFAAGMSTPPPVIVAPMPRGVVAILPLPAPEILISSDYPAAYHGRAPPAA